MKMPKPSAAHKKLHKLEGTWSGAESLLPSPFDAKGGPAKGRVKNKVALDGFAVVQDYQQKRRGKPSLVGHGVFRYDAGANEYQMRWLDSMGGPETTFRGSFEDKLLVLAAQSPQGHMRCTFEFPKKDAYVFTMAVSPDGLEWTQFMTGKYKRKD